jgi:hypothetical protein
MSHYKLLGKGVTICVACDNYDHISIKCEINPISWNLIKQITRKKNLILLGEDLGGETISEVVKAILLSVHKWVMWLQRPPIFI